MANINQIKLCELSLDSSDYLIVGMIVSKSDPIIFLSKTSSEYRGTMTITIRDSRKDFINCKIWNCKDKIEEYNKVHQIFDVVNIVGAKIIPIVSSEQECQQFQPVTTVPYVLVLNEGGNGFLERHQGVQWSQFIELIRVPLKPLSSTLHLADIQSSGINDLNSNGVQLVDLLVVVRTIRPIREFRNKNGKLFQCLDLTVIDKSLQSDVVLTIWNKEWIKRADTYWQPLKTVLHLIDVRVSYSQFYKCTAVGMCSRSLIMENPNAIETESLIEFVLKTPIPDTNVFTQVNALPKPETITTLMTVKQIYERAEGRLMDNSEEFTAVVIAMVTQFNLDGYNSIISKKCKFCQRRIFGKRLDCINEKCYLEYTFSNEKFDYFFDINIHLTDHTGTLIESRLSADVAERILGISVSDFNKITSDEKELLKWKILLEKFTVKLVIKKPSNFRKHLIIFVVDMITIQLSEVAENILVF